MVTDGNEPNELNTPQTGDDEMVGDRAVPPRLARIAVGGAVIGLLLGLLVGWRLFAWGPGPVTQEEYLVLAATLYKQTSDVAETAARLEAVDEPIDALVNLARKYDATEDQSKRALAKDLRQLAIALEQGPSQAAASGQPTAAAVAPAGPAGGTAGTPTKPGIGASPTTPGTAPTGASPSATSGQFPKIGRTKPVGGGLTRLRASTNTASTGNVVMAIPFDAEVRILSAVQGEAVEAGDATWYEVEYQGKKGYVYSKLIEVGG